MAKWFKLKFETAEGKCRRYDMFEYNENRAKEFAQMIAKKNGWKILSVEAMSE